MLNVTFNGSKAVFRLPELQNKTFPGKHLLKITKTANSSCALIYGLLLSVRVWCFTLNDNIILHCCVCEEAISPSLLCVCVCWITALQPVIFCQAIPWTNTLHPHHFGDSLNSVTQCWCSNSVRRPERKSVPVPASQIFWPVIVRLLHYKNRKIFYLPSSPLWRKSFKLHTSEKQFKLLDFHHRDSWFEVPSVRHFKCTYAAATNTHQLITLHINMEKG